MALKRPEELDFTNQKFSMIIAGHPGIGKTTLSLSAPDVLLVDVDKGISRVSPQFRKDSLQVASYEELLNDIRTNDLSKYNSISVDTGGSLFDLMTPYVIKQNAQNGQRDGTLSLKGYGAIAKEFDRFNNEIKDLGKHIIWVFHAKEEKDGDTTKLRIDVAGSTKNDIWRYIDIGGFVEMVGKNRTIGFSNSERFYAKGVHGISGTYTIPEVKTAEENNFLTSLFNGMRDKIISEQKENIQENTAYDKAMETLDKIKLCKNETHINAVVEIIKTQEHASTSERELKHHLHAKATELGLKYNKESGQYEKQTIDNDINTK